MPINQKDLRISLLVSLRGGSLKVMQSGPFLRCHNKCGVLSTLTIHACGCGQDCAVLFLVCLRLQVLWAHILSTQTCAVHLHVHVYNHLFTQEGGVQCTCKGFDFDLVRLWQKFRTHNMDHVNTELPKSNCNFCRHPLAEHLASESTADPATPPAQFEHSRSTSLKSVYGQLSLKASASVALSVALGNGTTLSLQLPSSIEGCKRMTTVVFHRIGDTKELELSVVTHKFGPLETNLTSDMTSTCDRGLEETESVLPDEGAPQIITLTQSTPVNGRSHATKRGTKRRKLSENTSPVPHENKRRSLRIAEREKRQKEKGKRSMSRKLEAFLEAKCRSESEIEEETVIKPLSEDEVRHLSGNAVEFVQSLSREESFSSCGKLPQVHVCICMYTVCTKVCLNCLT